MNARVFLIVVLTGLFMAAWNGDQAAKQQFLAQRAELRAARAVAQANEHSPVVSSEAISVSIANPDKTAPTRPVVSQFRPDGMAAGSYRAVNEHGVTFELTVDNKADAVSRDFYVADAPNGVRWYFVRVQPGS